MKKTDHEVKSLIREMDKTIQRYIAKRKPITLYGPVQYFFDGGGKRLRAVLLLLSSQLISRNYKKSIHAAAAVEILHNFSLVHDDIMDQDDLRRGRATIHKKWNTNIAILSGDVLAAIAFKALNQSPEKHIQKLVEIFSEGFIGLCEGQALDKEFESRSDVREADYLKMISQKTALLFSLSAQMGAILGGARKSQEKALKEFGYYLGMAFQIQDDLLDIISDEKILGKNIGSDLAAGKKTYISILASEKDQGRGMVNIFQSLTDEDIRKKTLDEFRRYLISSGVQARTQKMIDKYFQSALNRLQGFKNTKTKQTLIQLAHHMWKREN
ncbi:polyprenyl synthetase family protein [bacterium]|nr:polyprenyl synthetase family protein [bacterium]